MTEQINRKFYEAILNFETDRDSRQYYYETLYSKTGRILSDGSEEIVKNVILRAYGVLFCEDLDLAPGAEAGFDEVEATADRLYIGEVGFDPDHWYRMRYHFSVIDEDNFVRFAALVISDLKAGELHEAMKEDGDMLVVGALDPLSMSEDERKNQQIYTVNLPGEGGAV